MFSDPIKNLKTLALRESDVVADLGAGTGYYAIAAAKIVPSGKVYAVELQKDFLATIKHKAKEAHLSNVECFWGNVEKIGGTKIKEGVVDVVLASNIFFQVEDQNIFIEEIKRILKKGGRLLLIDWSDSIAFPLLEPVPAPQARNMFETKGFIYERQIDAGEHHYGMILVKK